MVKTMEIARMVVHEEISMVVEVEAGAEDSTIRTTDQRVRYAENLVNQPLSATIDSARNSLQFRTKLMVEIHHRTILMLKHHLPS